MSDDRYTLAGWLSIAAAVLFVLSFVVGIAQTAIAGRAFDYHGPMVGPSDAIGLLMAGLVIYVLLVFRRMLHERYGFHEIDMLITLTIVWNVMFHVGGLMLGVLSMVLGIGESVAGGIVLFGFFALAMVTIGVIDIVMAVRMLRAGGFPDLIRGFAYLTLVAGIVEVSVVLSPIGLLLVPISFVVLGMILLREPEAAEFV